MNNNAYINYEQSTQKGGRALLFIAVLLLMVPPSIMTFYFGLNPGIGAILSGVVSIVAVHGPAFFTEPISYYPIVGTTGLYMGFLSGNLSNVRIPAAVAAQDASGYKTGTNEGALVGTMGMAVSIWISSILILLAVVAGQTVLAQMPEGLNAYFSLIVPGLYGGVFGSFAYKAPITAVFALIVASVMMFVIGLIPFNLSFLITIVAVVATVMFEIRRQEKNNDGGEN